MKFDLVRYYHTLKYLRFRQIFYQVYYRLRKKFRSLIGFSYSFNYDKEGILLALRKSPSKDKSLIYREFCFLNKRKTFTNQIDWNYSEYGMLWAYHLNYMEYLLQEDMDKERGLGLIYEFIGNIGNNEVGIDPYPISLRGINWIKFISKYKISNKQIDSNLYSQYKILLNSLEYHLMGNHLLENAFSLLFGAFYFQDNQMYKKSQKLLFRELNEQILEDGGHFELSPMYHQIILERLLDSIDLVQNNSVFKHQRLLLNYLKEKCEKMFGWLNNITFSNGEIPHINDSTNGMSLTTNQLKEYGERLDLKTDININQLSNSGYRKFKTNSYECIVDTGQIGSDYIPGHAHADTLNFVLHCNGKPFLVDTGISTYEKNQRRSLERGTSSHNTVTLDNKNSSDVWGGFRVGKRAKTFIHEDKDNFILASHNGYARYGIIHTRKWNFKENEIIIEDKCEGKTDFNALAHFHFDHDLNPALDDDTIYIGDKLFMKFQDPVRVELLQYYQALGFNNLKESYKVVVGFNEKLITKIYC